MTCKSGELYLGEVGVRFHHQFLTEDGTFDLTDYDVAEIVFSKGATRVVRTCTVETPHTFGALYYVTSDGDIESHGEWQYQFTVELPGGVTRKSPVYSITVRKSL